MVASQFHRKSGIAYSLAVLRMLPRGVVQYATNSRMARLLRFAGALGAFCTLVALIGSSPLTSQTPPTFIKSADMSGALFLTTSGFPWDGNTSATLDAPFQDLENNGVNYVRLNCWYSTTSSSQGLNLSNLQDVAEIAVAHNMQIYIDAIPADGGNAFQSNPSEWQTDWNTATENGTNFNWDSTRGAALAADVRDYYNNIVTTLEADPNIYPSGIEYGYGQGPIGIVSIGNEINDYFVDVPSGTSLYYELVYKGAAGVKSADPNIMVMLHLHDIGSSQWNLAHQLADAHSLYGTPQIDFNIFGFSFHSFDNPLTNPSWEGSDGASSNGQTIGLVQAFQSENFGQFTNVTTNQPDSGTPIYLMVAETEWPWTGTAETVNGFSYPISKPSASDYVQDDSGYTNYQIDASGARQYLEDEMTDVSGMNDGLGIGVNDWAASVITGWPASAPVSHGDYNWAFWDSASGDLITSRDGSAMISAYSLSY